MKKILVVYYSQTGQLKKVIDSVVGELSQNTDITIDYEVLKPSKEYPFPWGEYFFDEFPNCVEETGCELDPFTIDFNKDYDLVIVGCQSWFLSPSVPVTAFFKHPQIKTFLKGKNILTLHGARNMCFNAQESIKKYIADAQGKLVGNIVLGDTNPNYISAITIIKWLVYGNKGPYMFLPNAGISDKTIRGAKRFAPVIKSFLDDVNNYKLQEELVKLRAVRVKFSVLMTELNAKKIFRKFSKYVTKAAPGSKEWHKRIKVFRAYLLFALFGLSPIAMIVFNLIFILVWFKSKKIIEYYQGIELK